MTKCKCGEGTHYLTSQNNVGVPCHPNPPGLCTVHDHSKYICVGMRYGWGKADKIKLKSYQCTSSQVSPTPFLSPPSGDQCQCSHLRDRGETSRLSHPQQVSWSLHRQPLGKRESNSELSSPEICSKIPSSLPHTECLCLWGPAMWDLFR